MVPRKPCLVSIALAIELYDISVSKMFASRPIFAGEWASEFEMRLIVSSAETRQFIGGSDESPVSMALIWGA